MLDCSSQYTVQQGAREQRVESEGGVKKFPGRGSGKCSGQQVSLAIPREIFVGVSKRGGGGFRQGGLPLPVNPSMSGHWVHMGCMQQPPVLKVNASVDGA